MVALNAFAPAGASRPPLRPAWAMPGTPATQDGPGGVPRGCGSRTAVHELRVAARCRVRCPAGHRAGESLERDWQQPGHARGSGRRCTAHKRCPQADRTAAPPTRSSPARRLPPQHPEQNVRCRARQNFSETYCPCIEVVVSETALAIFTNVMYIKRYRQPHSNAARPIVTSQHATQKTNATSRRCPHPPLPRGHLMVGVAARIALKWWYQYTHHAAGSSPLWGVGVLHAACTGRAAKRESSRSPSRSTRAVVGRRSVGARGGDAHDGAAALRRVRDVRAAARGRGRQRRGRALGNGDAVRRRVPFMSRLAARGEAGGGRPGRRKYLCIRTDAQELSDV